jgi:predicted nucleic acid-binding protein
LIAEKYRYSFYDSLIISAALSSGCKILFSEDLHHGQLIEGKLKIVNPFL